STSVLFATTLVLIELGRQPQAKLLPLILGVGASVLKNPLVGAPIIGALIGVAGIRLPESVHVFLSLGSSAASPCALVALGVFLAEPGNYAGTNTARTSALISVSKLVLHPALTLLIAYYVFALPAQLVYAATLLAALPTGTGPFMVAQLYQLEMSVTSRAIFTTTGIAVFSLALLMYLASRLGVAGVS
ncbi:AEC family transporter, partial [Hyphomicrobium sp.]|uniref:AEC family transporter n=1 Tax=Hyphomicrobium sp. TaxID=82 RepID=UPI0025C62ACF